MLLFAVVLVALAGLCGSVVHGDDRPVKIGLRSSWSHTPLLQEASEFFASEDAALFWEFVRHVDQQSAVTIESSDEAQYTFALEVGDALLSPEQKRMLQLRLAARSFSPTVELHRTLALAYERTYGSMGGMHESMDGAFAVIGHSVLSDPGNLANIVDKVITDEKPVLLEGDHIHGNGNLVVLLYANIGSPKFRAFHEVLMSLPVTYVLRHRPPVFKGRPVRLSGFGAEMHLKSTEYKVVDDSSSAASGGGKGDQLEPVPKKEVGGLGVRIAQSIATSSDPLESLQRLSQNFPVECHSYRHLQINETFLQTVVRNQQRMRAGHTAVLINGRHVNVENVNYFQLLDIVGEEIKSSVLLRSVPNVTPEMARRLTIRHTFHLQHQQPHFDVRSSHVRWLNDVEKDRSSAAWPTTLRGFLRQQWPGMPYGVRRNAINAIALADLSQAPVVCSLASVARRMGLISVNDGKFHTLGAVRVGVVPLGSSRRAQVMGAAFNSLMNDVSAAAATKLLSKVCEEGVLQASTDAAFVSGVENALAAAGSSATVLRLEKNGGLDSVAKASTWCEDSFGMSLNDVSNGPLVVNGVLYRGEGEISEVLSRAITEQTQKLQMIIYQGQLSDHISNVHEWVLMHNSASNSFSRFSLPKGGPYTPFVPLVATQPERNKAFDAVLADLSFYGTCSAGCAVSHVAVVDLALPSSRKLLEVVVDRALEKSDNVRIALVLVNRPKLAKKVMNLWKAKKLDDIVDIVNSASASNDDALTEPSLCPLLNITNGLVTNGRVIRLSESERLSRNDLAAIEEEEFSKRADRAKETVKSLSPSLTGAALSDALMRICSVLGLEHNNGVARHDLSQYAQASVTIPAKTEKHPVLVIDALLDPLSEAGKKFGSILLRLISVFECEVNLVLNPITQLDDLPLKQFYRYVVATHLSFDAQGQIDSSTDATAIFPDLPSETLFSMSLDVPDSWIVDAVAAPYDLDNLRLADIAEEPVGALYELTHLAVSGSCHDVSPQKSPLRGMQLHLHSVSGPDTSYETLVMETDGYFQLKSTPGLWKLSLSGRSAELFEIDGDARVEVHQFSGRQHTINVKRRDVTSTEPLLPVDHDADAQLKEYALLRAQGKNVPARAIGSDEDQDGGGMFSSWFASGKKPSEEEARAMAAKHSHETIHVFSIASGHLYERFLSIMMYTTVRSTKNKVKFWFLRQFLSPQFKRFLPKMAEKYGFEFELVTYNFPRWLRRQTEKQRHIWAYKILFLDVLFPSSVDRIIFVDADQIVREDLLKLRRMDLHGAVYGFTPFCSRQDNRRYETKGFRFWESGYWKDTLGPLPYHISALFVVDLKRFRQLAAGDILRSSYQQLSQDPGSLANLDQDLPNVLQQRLTIYSLPEEWLWCETWCTDKSFPSALSIDLCNNPQNKVPKLDMAKRLFPDWSAWDAELNELRKESESKWHEADISTLRAL